MSDLSDTPVPYSSSNDTVVGGPVYHAPQPSQTSAPSNAYSSAQDTLVGDTSSAPPPPGILQTAWKKISDGAHELWLDAGGVIHTFDTPENREAGGAGFVRGVRDVTDKTMEYPNPELGYTPPDADLDTVRSQNIADRAAAEQKYGDNASFRGTRILGQTAITAPVVAPLGAVTSAGIRALPLIGPLAETATSRGLLGIGGRLVDRAVTGAVTGGTQAGLTSDPTQPLAPQIEAGAITAGVLSPATGLVLDPITNAIRRLMGNTVPVRSQTGTPYNVDTARATQGQTLLNEGVPVQASQVSPDPVLQTADKIGAPVPGSGSANFLKGQQEDFRNAALQRVDPTERGSIVDQNFIDRNDDAIGRAYDGTVRAVQNVPATAPGGLPLGVDIANIRSRIPTTLLQPEQNQINAALDHVMDEFVNGSITGDAAHALTRRTNGTLSPLFDSDNPTVRQFGADIRNQINTRLNSQMTPQQQVMFNQANSQFRALRTLQDVAGSDGSFTPGDLYGGTQNVTARFGAPGTLDGLAQAGNTVIQPTLNGRAAFGRVANTAAASSPFLAGAATSAAAKQLLEWLGSSSGLTGAGIAGSVIAGNRGIQAMNRAGGPRAINATLAGGGPRVSDLQTALTLLGVPAVATMGQANQPPSQ